MGDLPGGNVHSDATGISPDGAVIVGVGESASGFEAFRWTSGGGMVGLGDLPGGTFNSSAVSISADGAVIVGGGNSASGDEVFRWTSGGGMVGLGDLSGGVTSCYATATSADGAVLVGHGTSASGTEAFRWTSGGGMDGEIFASHVYATAEVFNTCVFMSDDDGGGWGDCFTVVVTDCGDGVIDGGEECDDGNSDDGDGCSSTCHVEEGFECSEQPSVCVPIVIPTVSEWGLIAMTVLMLTAGTLVLARRRRVSHVAS